MDLATLRFVSDTTDLERASKVIAGLVTDVSKLDKASRDAAKTEEILAKAAKLNADAHLQNAKAQDVRLKSTIAADKADKDNEQSTTKKTKAVEAHTQATKDNVSILQRQQDIYEYQTQGFSKGQAIILANAKATGQWSKQLEEILELQRQFSSNTFDKSETGLKRMVKASKEASAAQGFLNEGYSLTSKQARELSNDLDRQSASLKQQGNSYQEISKAQEAYKQNFVNEAVALNKSSDALAVVEKQRRDAVSATNYLTQADEKMNAALNASNKAFDKAGTDSIVKYETALRQSGVSQEVATQRLAKYRVQLEQVQKQEQARREGHLTRALAPQATDVAVSLWSGQNPLTVLLQQGGQINDLFMQSGIAAERFGEVVKKSMASMLPSLITVAKGVGVLIVDGFVSAGKAANDFLARSVGVSGALDAAWKKASENGPSQYAAQIAKLSTGLTILTSVGIVALVTSLVSLGIAFKNALKEGAELSRNLELTGASLALTKSAAIDLAQSLATSERPVASVVSVINELTKAGKFSSENIALVTNAAIDLERYGKVSIAETAKELAKLREDPVKALIEVAEKTGYVTLETIENIKSLREQGKMADAAELAMKAWATSSSSAATSIKNQMSPLEQVWDSILSKINQVIGRLQNLARGSGLAEQIADKEAQLASVKGGFFTSTFGLSPKGAKDVDRLSEEIYMLKLQLQAETDITKERAKRSSAATQLKAETDATKEYTAAIEKQEGKEATLSEFVKKALEERTRSVAAALSKNVDDVKLSADAIDKITKGAELQWKEMQKKPKVDRQPLKDLETEIDLRNKALGLLGSFNNELDAIERRRAKSGDEDQYQKSLNALIKKQPIYLERQKEINAAHDLTNKLFGKADMLGKDYYKTLEQINKEEASGLRSPENAGRARQAAFDQTELAKTRLKIEQDSAKLVEKYRDDIEKAQNASSLETANLDDRLALLGLTSEQQKNLRIEQERRNKLLAIDLKLQTQIQEVWDKWGNGEFGVDGATKAKAVIKELTEQAGVDMQNVNKKTAVKFREDFDAELSKIKSGVTDSIVTALFEGGKAGSKKLREVLVNVLRQKVTMVVDVGVNAFMNSLIGGALGKGGVVQAGSSALSTVGSVGSGYSALAGIGGTFGGGIAGGFGGLMGSLGLSATGSTLGGALSAGGIALQSGNILGGLGTLVGALGPIAAGIGIIASVIGKDDSGTPHRGGASTYSSALGLSNTNLDAANSIGFSARNNAGVVTFTNQIAKTLTEVFDSTAVAFGKTAGYEITAAFADDTSKDGAWGQLRIKQGGQSLVDWSNSQTSKWAPKVFSDGEAGQKEYFAAIALSARDALKTAIGEVSWASDLLDALGNAPTIEQLSTTVNQINQVQASFKLLGDNISWFGKLTNQTLSSMVESFGGISQLQTALGSFYDNFFTEEEKRKNIAKNASAALASAGVDLSPEDILGATKPIIRNFVDTILAQFGPSSPQYVAAVQQANVIAGLYTDVTEAVSELSEVMKGLKEETANLEIELLRAKGDVSGANAAQRTLDTQGFTEAEIAVYDYNQSIRDQINALTKAKAETEKQTAETEKQTNTRLGLERQLLQLHGDTEALRLLDIAGMDEYNVKLYDQIQSFKDTSAAAETFAANMKNLREGLISLEGRFTGGGFSKQYKAEDAAKEVNSLLSSVGINKDVATITSALLNSTTDEVESYFREIWGVLDTDEARLRLVQVSNAMLNIATTSETAAEKFQKQSDSFSKLASEVASLFEARNTAGNLLDKIAGAMGNQGSFAGQRESELWSALGSTNDYKKKVELASQLTDIVLQRQQLEIQNAERLLSFGQSLRDYVNGLKLSDLSPLTNTEKLAEASKQYSETLSKAIGGDTNAQSGLQAISSSYLELARTYYAGNEQFSDIFNSVTSALDTLGINSMTESQQQLAIGNQSLGELQKLYGITETAYEALNTQYENSLSQLIAAQDALVLQASSLEQLVSISNLLTALPTEIAVRMPIVNTELSSLNSSSAGATSDSSNADLLEELRLLRIQVAKLEASNREDARMQADVFVGTSQATADSIASATTKAARANEIKQGATIK